MSSARSRLPHVLFALHSVVATFCVVGPGYRWWGASARPFVLGLPWSLTWALIWLVAVFASLLLYERFTRSVEDEAPRRAEDEAPQSAAGEGR